MSQLDEILETVRSGKKAYPNWLALRHGYFKGDNPVKDCQEWAEKNGIVALFRFKEESLHHRVVEDVVFLPKRVRQPNQTK